MEIETKNNISKTIFLIGSTGKGKSTLANTLTNKVNKKGLFEEFQEIFKESQASVSGTREIQKEEFWEDNINYVVIDTVGLGDTKLKREEVLDKIAEAVYLAREGISHIFFVIGIKFDAKEMANYNLLKSIIFDQEVVNHTTIIRTRFENFQDQEKCKSDISSMTDKNDSELAEIIKSCQARVIHVDNPSLNLIPNDNENDKEKKDREEKIVSRKETRSISRKKVIEHLKQVCQEEVYQPTKLKKLSKEISAYMEDKIKKRKELAEKEKKWEEPEEENESINDVQDLKTETDENESKLKKPPKKTWKKATRYLGKFFKKEKQKIDRRSEKSNSILIKLEISQLESEIQELEDIKKLKEEIEQAEKTIQQKVLEHIFDNLNDINQAKGWETFINNITEDKDFGNNSNNLSISELQEKMDQIRNKLLEKKDDKSFKDIKDEIENKEQELLNLKKELLTLPEIAEKWQEQGFTLSQAQEWAEVLGQGFQPESDIPFCVWLWDNKQLTPSPWPTQDLVSLREQYQTWLIVINQQTEEQEELANQQNGN
jgi:hypothetical protein